MSKKVMLNFELDDELRNEFKKMCAERGHKMNFVLEKMIRKWIDGSKIARQRASSKILFDYKAE